MRSRAKGSSSQGLMLRLAGADLKNEWILTACLVLAVAAVLSPLLLLFGVKSGTIETLRHRLLQDPRNREIRPMISASFASTFFQELKDRSDVVFVLPTTRQISTSVQVRVLGDSTGNSSRGLSLDLIPTAIGDPLLMDNQTPVPSDRECVLSFPAAEAMKVQAGDRVQVTARRIVESDYESGRMQLEVAAVLPLRGGALKAVYVPLPVVEAVEAYKDGQAVSRYGWPGSAPRAYPVYDGAAVVLPQPLDPVRRFSLVSGTGFSRISDLSAREFQARTGVVLPQGRTAYLLAGSAHSLRRENIRALELKLRGRRAHVLPLVDEQSGVLTEASSGLSLPCDLRACPPLPQGLVRTDPLPREVSFQSSAGRPARWIQVPDQAGPVPREARLRVSVDQRVLEIPVQVLEQPGQGKAARISLDLAAIINLLHTRNIDFDSTLDQFLLSRRGYAGFRLYAATLEDVDVLQEYFQSRQIPVHTQADRIRDVLELDTYLSVIFWLIAVVGLVGGAAALSASLYASIERKHRDLGILRLLGFSRNTLFRFPLYQGICIGSLGCLLAIAVFAGLSQVINALFQAHLQAEESLCTLSAFDLGITLAATVLLSALTAFAASWRTTRIDPSEALRDE